MFVVTSILVGMALGLSLAAPPGPMNAVIAEESVLRGWVAGTKAGLGAMTADAIFFVLALAGVVTFVQDMPTLRGVMVGLGGLLMLYFAYGAAHDARRTFTTSGDAQSEKGFQKALVLALTNPFQIIWWLTAGVGLLNPGTIEVLGYRLATTGGPVLIGGFFAGIVVWIVGFPGTLVAAGRRVDVLAPIIAYLSAAVLAVFGLSFLYVALQQALALAA